jgi:site-specific recombinase XerD
MTQYRGATALTVLRYQIALRPFFDKLGTDPRAYNVSTVRDFVIRRLRTRGRPWASLAITALRSFLRFTCAEGLTPPGLERCVPPVARWRLSSLPRYLSPNDVEKVTSSCDLSKAIGVRDRAILLLLARLALRAGDIVKLTIDDVNWEQGTIRVCGKGRREVLLPLPQDVGDAVLAYLRDARPSASTNRLFLMARAPIKPFASSASVSQIVHFALDRAGIKDPPSHGANLLRHSAATSMLRSGGSLDMIGAVLRHRSPETTAHYAKVDVVMLRQLTQAWPVGGEAC